MSDEEKKSKQSLVTVSSEWHHRLLDIAAERTAAKGKRVTIREIVEEALEQACSGQPHTTYSGVDAGMAVDLGLDKDGEATFAKLYELAFMSDNGAVEQLGDATIAGSAGQRIELRKLAYYLRETTAEIATLGDLVKAFEEGR